MWEFYREQTDVCGAKLSSLYDRSASSRHKLHRKLGGAPTGVAAPVADAGFGGDASPGGGGESCSTPSKSNFDLLGAVGRTEGFLNNSIAAAQVKKVVERQRETGERVKVEKWRRGDVVMVFLSRGGRGSEKGAWMYQYPLVPGATVTTRKSIRFSPPVMMSS